MTIVAERSSRRSEGSNWSLVPTMKIHWMTDTIDDGGVAALTNDNIIIRAESESCGQALIDSHSSLLLKTAPLFAPGAGETCDIIGIFVVGSNPITPIECLAATHKPVAANRTKPRLDRGFFVFCH